MCLFTENLEKMLGGLAGFWAAHANYVLGSQIGRAGLGVAGMPMAHGDDHHVDRQDSNARSEADDHQAPVPLDQSDDADESGYR